LVEGSVWFALSFSVFAQDRFLVENRLDFLSRGFCGDLEDSPIFRLVVSVRAIPTTVAVRRSKVVMK
jgi:hypothetical protein